MNRKYSLLVLSFFITLGLFLIIIGLLEATGPGQDLIPKEYMEFIPALPGTIYTDILLLFAIPIGAFALIYALTPIISKILVYFHKLIMRGATYGFAQLGADIKTATFLKRAFMISLFAFNLSAILVGLGYGGMFRLGYDPTKPSEQVILNEAEAVFLGTFILATAGLIVFMPLWIAEDAGLIMYRIFPDQRRAPDIEGIHAMYSNLWKAYISISTLYTLWEYISRTFAVLKPGDPAILTPIILCVLPFITIGLVSIPAYLYEKYLPGFKDRVSSGLRGFNLPDIQIPEIHQIGVDRIAVD
ncbi:MAG: hypothetical protein JW839_22505 [Candidatus Lokiarchaeota archaeon]|nr:hypothetical protein [Candidatus Lokiarchaeota archaeon]